MGNCDATGSRRSTEQYVVHQLVRTSSSNDWKHERTLAASESLHQLIVYEVLYHDHQPDLRSAAASVSHGLRVRASSVLSFTPTGGPTTTGCVYLLDESPNHDTRYLVAPAAALATVSELYNALASGPPVTPVSAHRSGVPRDDDTSTAGRNPAKTGKHPGQ